jgi:hypothetical protein
VGVSPLAELSACLHQIAEPEHHLEVRAWLTRVSAELSEELRGRLTTYASAAPAYSTPAGTAG